MRQILDEGGAYVGVERDEYPAHGVHCPYALLQHGAAGVEGDGQRASVDGHSAGEGQDGKFVLLPLPVRHAIDVKGVGGHPALVESDEG
jgi:hypothetical protein